jgi:hypothetical protein
MNVRIVGVDVVNVDISDHSLAGEVFIHELLSQEQFGLIIDLGREGEDEGTGKLSVGSFFASFN